MCKGVDFREYKRFIEHSIWLNELCTFQQDEALETPYSTRDQPVHVRPLSFNKFFNHSNKKLRKVFEQQFKKDMKFNELLMEICKIEIR
jgi:hypothetical protein